MSKTLVLILTLLGGFRGIVSEVIWFRMDRLQDECRYAEIAQLASILTQLEPKSSEVWSYAAWNLAYNVSVMMPTPADRWRWVKAGLKLLRDDGLKINPNDPTLYREIAWLYLAKIGGNLDEAHDYYHKAWAEEVRATRAQNTWANLALNPAHMAIVEKCYGKLDWENPKCIALYFADCGLQRATRGQIRFEMMQLVYQSLMALSIENAEKAPYALAAMRAAYAEYPSGQLKDLIARYRARFLLK